MDLANLGKVAGCSHGILMVVEALQRKDGKHWELVHNTDVVAENFEDLSRHYVVEQKVMMWNMVALIARMYDNKVGVFLLSAVHVVDLDVSKHLELLFALTDHEMNNYY